MLTISTSKSLFNANNLNCVLSSANKRSKRISNVVTPVSVDLHCNDVNFATIVITATTPNSVSVPAAPSSFPSLESRKKEILEIKLNLITKIVQKSVSAVNPLTLSVSSVSREWLMSKTISFHLDLTSLASLPPRTMVVLREQTFLKHNLLLLLILSGCFAQKNRHPTATSFTVARCLLTRNTFASFFGCCYSRGENGEVLSTTVVVRMVWFGCLLLLVGNYFGFLLSIALLHKR